MGSAGKPATSGGSGIEKKAWRHSLVFPDQDFSGTVASIDTRLDPVSRAVEVRAVIPNTDGLLKPGMFMTVDLQRDRGDVMMAPEQAIVPEGFKEFPTN